MKVVRLCVSGGSPKLVVGEAERPQPKAGEVLVRVHANSLNFHDFMVVSGIIPADDGRILLSDGAGVVEQVGDGVTRFAPGSHVVSTFFPNWIDGAPTPASLAAMPGDRTDGYAAEYVAVPERALTRAPQGYSHAEAATLPCAALTAWRALFVEAQIKPGDWVLVLGSGGVSVFALQFAKMAGARVVATSSSDEKLSKLRQLGADALINYKSIPEWGAEVLSLTGGRGVDTVVEVGGVATINQSVQACRPGALIAVIGAIGGGEGAGLSPHTILGQRLTLKGIFVGSRTNQEDMIAAIEANAIKPVIDRSFSLDDMQAAFDHQTAQKHFGKIVIEH